MISSFPLARGSRLTASLVGNEQEAVLQTDATLERPHDLVELAASSAFTPAYSPAGGYPGLRARLPDDYISSIVGALAGPLSDAFALGPIRPVWANGALSMVTLSTDALVPPQRAPHVDSTHPMQFAILHYLCDERFGGTSFYRHRSTGFETIDDARLAVYSGRRREEMAPQGYVDDGAPWFERTARISASFNRLIAYRSCVLHSGHVPDASLLSADPKAGRLTANVFVLFEPIA